LAAAHGCELTAGGTIMTGGDGRTAVPCVYRPRRGHRPTALGGGGDRDGSRAALAVALDYMAVAAAA
jgi:hypothetical protein